MLGESKMSTKKSIRRKALSWALTICMVIALVPMITITASAAEIHSWTGDGRSILVGNGDTVFYVIGLDTPPPPVVNPFTDIAESAWYFADVMYVYTNGLMTGVSQTLFDPNSTLTRAMIVTILYRQAGEPDVSGYDYPFSDVADGEWYTDAVIWAAENNIVGGYGDGAFGTTDPITRQDMAAILLRYMNHMEIVLPVTQQWIIFGDEGDIADYAMDAIQTLYKLEVISGTGDNADGQAIIDPKASATRAQAAALLHGFMKLIG